MIFRIAATAAALLLAGPAVAQQAIGKAIAITVNVSGANDADQRPIVKGDGVFEHEQISTDTKGTGQFELLDQTRLALGPGSSVKLDQFVYNADKKATAVVIEVGRGALRFISGKSDSRVYSIRTPAATLGVRGTAFDIYVAPDGQMAVAMINGRVEICPRGGACRMHDLVGRFLRLTPAGAFSVHDRWDAAIFGGVAFGAALPFLATQSMLMPGFRANNSVASRYTQILPKALEETGKAVPNLLLQPLKQLNPFR
jgi:ferric-dicitrate binding protein FerR (iron transport regulator)